MKNYKIFYNSRSSCFVICKNNTTIKKIDANINIADTESVPEYCVKGGQVGSCLKPPHVVSPPFLFPQFAPRCPKGYCDNSNKCIVNCCASTVDNTDYCANY